MINLKLRDKMFAIISNSHENVDVFFAIYSKEKEFRNLNMS